MANHLAPAEFREVVRNTPLISIDLVVRTMHGKVLLGLRTNEPAKGSLFVPGGRIMKDERLEEAFDRITQAEIGRSYAISKARLLGVFQHLYDTNAFELPGFGTHYVVLGLELQIEDEIINLPKAQHSEYTWMTESEARKHPQVHENTKRYFELEKTDFPQIYC